MNKSEITFGAQPDGYSPVLQVEERVRYYPSFFPWLLRLSQYRYQRPDQRHSHYHNRHIDPMILLLGRVCLQGTVCA